MSAVGAVVAASEEVRAGATDRRGEAGDENPTGDEQVAADRWIDDLLFERFRDVAGVGAFVSEGRPGAGARGS